MIKVNFTRALQRHIACAAQDVVATSVRGALDAAFAANPAARGYVLDDAGAVRKHMLIFVDGQPIDDRLQQSDAVEDGAEIYIMQALSGG